MPDVTIDNTVGVMFLGLLVAVALWGASCAQLITYIRTSAKDSMLMRLFVAAVWLADTISLALFGASLYFYLITHFNSIAFLVVIPISLPVAVPFIQATGTLVQSFYAYRIWRLSQRNIVLTSIAITLIAAETALGIIYTVWTLPLYTLGELNIKMGPLTTAYSTMTVVADWYLAGVLCWLFVRNRSRSRADSVLHRLIIFTVTSGLLPSLCALAVFFAHVLDPFGVIYIAPFFCAGKLYVLSLLGALNMRRTIRAALAAGSSGYPNRHSDAESGELQNAESDKQGSVPLGRRVRSRHERATTEVELSIKIDTVCESVVDPSETSPYSHSVGAPGANRVPARKWARRFTPRSRSLQRGHEAGAGARVSPALRDAQDATAVVYTPQLLLTPEHHSEDSVGATGMI